MGESESEEERRNPSTPRGAPQSGNQGTSGIPRPTTPPHTPTCPPPPSPLPHTPTPPPPPPPLLFIMENTIKFPVLSGHGSEVPKQFWFVIEALWKAQDIDDDDMKKAQLVTVLQDRALT